MTVPDPRFAPPELPGAASSPAAPQHPGFPIPAQPDDDGRFRPARPRPWADIAVAAAFFLLVGVFTAVIDVGWNRGIFGAGTIVVDPITGTIIEARKLVVVLAGLGMPIAAIWRASHPVPSAVTIYALALLHFLVLPTVLPVDLVIFLSLYSTTVHGPRWAERTALAGGLAGALMLTMVAAIGASSIDRLPTLAVGFVLGAALVLLAWGAGLLRRSQAAHRESLKERAARLERERDQQSELATAAERTRIAREMHDIVAHSLSVVIAQADGGRYAAAADPPAATRALETIAETGRAALADMRRILGVLRSDGNGAEPLAPQPSTVDLESLFSHLRATGVPVSHVQMGTPVGLPPGTSAALFRITQESLTNVLKHGGPGVKATVLTDWRPGEVRLVISDDGRGAASTADAGGNDGIRGGHGLVGMRERAVMLGGSLAAGPGPSGGFRVEARIPIGGDLGDPTARLAP